MNGVKGYYRVLNRLCDPKSDKQDAATFGYIQDEKGNDVPGECVIVIDTSLMNGTNNTIDKVVAAVRKTLEHDVERRKKLKDGGRVGMPRLILRRKAN